MHTNQFILMDTLPRKIINEILLLVDRPTLFYTSQVSVEWRLLSLTQVKIVEDMNEFSILCELGDRLSVIKNKIDVDWLDAGLYSACEGNHRDLVDLMILKGADKWDWGLLGASRGGHKDLVNLMIHKGATNFSEGVTNARLNHHQELAQFLITMIIIDDDPYDPYDASNDQRF